MSDGYQITGIANRTTIADGNTWNHEHIALLGRTLTAPEKEAHRIARHLADYVLVWAGGGGDDVAKSPHLRRIANSVYRGLCEEPTCRDFGFYVSDSFWFFAVDLDNFFFQGSKLIINFAILFAERRVIATQLQTWKIVSCTSCTVITLFLAWRPTAIDSVKFTTQSTGKFVSTR